MHACIHLCIARSLVLRYTSCDSLLSVCLSVRSSSVKCGQQPAVHLHAPTHRSTAHSVLAGSLLLPTEPDERSQEPGGRGQEPGQKQGPTRGRLGRLGQGRRRAQGEQGKRQGPMLGVAGESTDAAMQRTPQGTANRQPPRSQRPQHQEYQSMQSELRAQSAERFERLRLGACSSCAPRRKGAGPPPADEPVSRRRVRAYRYEYTLEAANTTTETARRQAWVACVAHRVQSLAPLPSAARLLHAWPA